MAVFKMKLISEGDSLWKGKKLIVKQTLLPKLWYIRWYSQLQNSSK